MRHRRRRAAEAESPEAGSPETGSPETGSPERVSSVGPGRTGRRRGRAIQEPAVRRPRRLAPLLVVPTPRWRRSPRATGRSCAGRLAAAGRLRTRPRFRRSELHLRCSHLARFSWLALHSLADNKAAILRAVLLGSSLPGAPLVPVTGASYGRRLHRPKGRRRAPPATRPGPAGPAAPSRAVTAGTLHQFEHHRRLVGNVVQGGRRWSARASSRLRNGLSVSPLTMASAMAPGSAGWKRASREDLRSDELSLAIVGAPHAMDSTTGSP